MDPSRRSGKILVLSSRAPQLTGEAAQIAFEWRQALTIVPRLYEMKVKMLDLSRYHGVVFTSVHAVEVFVAVLRSLARDARALAGLRLAAVGGETAAALRARLLEPDLIGEGGGALLAHAILEAHWSGPLLYPQGADGRPELAAALQAAGLAVDVVPAYDALVDDEQLRAAIAQHATAPYTAVAVGSPRIAARWLELGGDRALPHGALGATTAQHLGDAGIAAVVAPTPSLEALLVALASA